MGKVRKPISDIKKANIAKNRNRSERKLNKRRKERQAKRKKNVVVEKEPITYYDHKRLREKQKEEKIKQAEERKAQRNANHKNKKKIDDSPLIPMHHGLGIEDMLDPEDLEALMRAEDLRIEEVYSNDNEENKEDLVQKAKQLLLGEGNNEEEEEETIHASAAEEFHHKTTADAFKRKEAEKEAAAAAEPTNDLLPIVVANKVIQPTLEPLEEDSGIEKDGEDDEDEETKGDEKEKPSVPKRKVSVIEILAQRKRKIHEKKVFIGCTATRVVRNPGGNMGGLMELVKLVYEPDVDVMITVRKMAALSLLQVFDSILPSYRLATMDVAGVRLKKMTKAVALEEGKLLSRYKYFLKGLESMLDYAQMKKYSPVQLKLANLALKCFCHLLKKHPVFNFSENIMSLVVPFLSHRIDDLRVIAVDCFHSIFYDDDSGQLSLRLLKVIDKFVRKRSFQIHEDALKVLLQLRVTHSTALDTTSAKRIESIRDAAAVEKNLKNLASHHSGPRLNDNEKKRKRKIAKLEFKLQGKRREEAKHKHETLQSEILQLMFGLYLHCIKNNPNRRLLGMVLEGLATFGHLVDVSFFCDLLQNLHRVLVEQNLTLLESVHCIQTVFKLLTGLGNALPNDPSNFSDKLFALLLQISARENPEVALPMLRTIILIFIGCKKRMADQQSIGFAKRLSTLSLALQHSQAVPVLMTLRSIMLNHRGTECLLDPSREGGSGVYRADLNHPIHCNATMTALWEMHLIARAYHPMMRQVGTHLYKGAPLLGEGCLPASFTKLNVDEVHRMYDSSAMQLQPHLVHPDHHFGVRKPVWSNERRKQVNRHRLEAEFQAFCAVEDRTLDGIMRPDRKKQQQSDEDNVMVEDEELESTEEAEEHTPSVDDDDDMPDTFSDVEQQDNEKDIAIHTPKDTFGTSDREDEVIEDNVEDIDFYTVFVGSALVPEYAEIQTAEDPDMEVDYSSIYCADSLEQMEQSLSVKLVTTR
uniref:NOC3-like protein n=1 Tax=Hirondellea gigas TaxID=1518452 RepID=A0A2P2HY98_9CRUS